MFLNNIKRLWNYGGFGFINKSLNKLIKKKLFNYINLLFKYIKNTLKILTELLKLILLKFIKTFKTES